MLHAQRAHLDATQPPTRAAVHAKGVHLELDGARGVILRHIDALQAAAAVFCPGCKARLAAWQGRGVHTRLGASGWDAGRQPHLSAVAVLLALARKALLQ